MFVHGPRQIEDDSSDSDDEEEDYAGDLLQVKILELL